MTRYFCCNEQRRKLVDKSPLNGIDYLEVDDDLTKPASERQRRLFVRFLKDLTPGELAADHIRIVGGETVRQFAIESLAISGSLLTVTLDHPGDFSRYILRLVAGSSSPDEPPAGFDPLLSTVDFSFKVNCQSDFDCSDLPQCPRERVQEPDLNYLARDFNSFRQLMIDRLSVLIPDWREQSVADLMHVLIDLKAYLADYQSYQQDAVATEAYLGTARRRISVRRHSRLVDYYMHDGCNARVWVQVKIDPSIGPDAAVVLPSKTQLLTRVAGAQERLDRDIAAYRQALETGPVVFETMHEATLYGRHNRMCFYTWGDHNCCLPRGATRATLEGDFPNLCEGDVLIFEELYGPATGEKADRDPMHRHAVRLTKVQPKSDPIETPPVRITEICWHPSDALPFPLCISSDVEMKEGDGEPADTECPKKVSVAFGNIVLADHGRTLPKEDLGSVPPVRFHYAETLAFCEDSEPKALPPRFRPRLKEGPLTQAAPLYPLLVSLDFDPAYATRLDNGEVPARVLDLLTALRTIFNIDILKVEKRPQGWVIRDSNAVYVVRREIIEHNGSPVEKLNLYDYPPAAASVRTALQKAMPAITLESREEGVPFKWFPRHDLLNSSSSTREFVAEVESDGSTRLRFGDDLFGKRPNEGSSFGATYRIGNGPGGNIGAEAIRHIATGEAAIFGVRNPLAAEGGTEPEDIEDVRLKAPHAYRVQERAVTPADYAAIAQRHPEVQRAVATFRWTGSWYTVFLTIDRFGGREIDQAFETSVRAHMERYRMAGYDLEVDAPHYVPLEIALEVCVLPEYFRSEVRRDLLDLFSNRVLPDGRLGVFHPDNISFGQTVHLSRLYAAAESVAGVESVQITTFQHQDRPTSSGLESGKLVLGTREIARLDNDPNYPKRGVLRLKMKGGK